MKNNIENLIANVVVRHEDKHKQLEKMQEICIHLTSDDGICIKAELYKNNVCRFLIQGTRCNMTITYNTLTWDLTRKPRGEKPWHTQSMYNRNIYTILERVKEIKL